MTIIDVEPRSCEKCGKPFEPRSGSGGSLQRFCCTGCRLGFHKERLRSQRRGLYAGRSTGVDTAAAHSQRSALYAGRPPRPATVAHSKSNADTDALESGFLMREEDFVEVTWDQCGNLLLRQGRGSGGDHELHIGREYFPRFLETVDALRELIVEAIRKDRAR
jgi:hypothetical protein